VKCTLVEPPSTEGDENCNGADVKTVDGDSGINESSPEEIEVKMRQRAAFAKTRSKIERNLHVLKPSVIAVTQLGQEMLGSIQIMDFNSPR